MEQKPTKKTAGAATPSKKKKKMSKRTKRTVLAVVLSAIAVGALTVLIVGGYMMAYVISFMNGDPVLNLDEYKNNQNQTTILYSYNKDGEPVEMARLHGTENRIWVNIDDMPTDLWQAAIAMEDKRFEDHHGVDWVRTVGVILMGEGGGSTITQQLIKNLTNNKDVTYVRKFNEICTALNLEKNLEKTIGKAAGKKAILEAYLNTFYLGEGCYGVQTAAETYFGKDVKDLNLAECATLVSITKAPYDFDPLIHPEDNKKRQEYCLSEMLDQKRITKEEYEEAVHYPLVFTNSPDYVAPKSADGPKQPVQQEITSYYTDYVIDTVSRDLAAAGYTDADNMINYGGLKIYTAVDPEIQTIMESVYQNDANFHHAEAQSAMFMMDYEGRVVAVVGGRGEKKGSRVQNRATQSFRPAGSSFKPLTVYAPAIENGLITWSTLVPDTQITVRGNYWPQQNDNGGTGSGALMTIQRGLSTSTNMIAGHVIQMLGIDTSYEFVTSRFHLDLDGYDRDWSPLALGSLTYGVSPEKMAAAFATFGNGGKYYEPYCYYKVTDSSGKKVYLENTVAPVKAMEPDTADVMNELLQTVTTEGTGTGARLNSFKTYGKTGTSDKSKDRWFVGGTPYYAAAVWYGFDTPAQMSGGNRAATLFKTVMDRVHSGLPAKDFQKYGDAQYLDYCTNTGLLAAPGCPTAKGWYKKSFVPEVCTACNGGSVPADVTTAPPDATQGAEASTNP